MILYIIAAGNSSRMGFLPKAASIVNGKINLYNTVELAYSHFTKIVVVSNEENKKFYKEIIEDFSDKCEVTTIVSGLGCGHAIKETLDKFKDTYSINYEDCIICWGDTYFQSDELFKELIKKEVKSLLIPVVKESNPYVWFKTNSDEIRTAMFSKKAETCDEGLHDQSIFKINIKKVRWALHEMHNVLFKNERYIDNEMIFLNICHYLWNNKTAANFYETKFKTLSFNTQNELKEINDFIKHKNEKRN